MAPLASTLSSIYQPKSLGRSVNIVAKFKLTSVGFSVSNRTLTASLFIVKLVFMSIPYSADRALSNWSAADLK